MSKHNLNNPVLESRVTFGCGKFPNNHTLGGVRGDFTLKTSFEWRGVAARQLVRKQVNVPFEQVGVAGWFSRSESYRRSVQFGQVAGGDDGQLATSNWSSCSRLFCKLGLNVFCWQYTWRLRTVLPIHFMLFVEQCVEMIKGLCRIHPCQNHRCKSQYQTRGGRLLPTNRSKC